MTNLLVLAALVAAVAGARGDPETCLRCHRTRSPIVVDHWLSSRHAREGIGCAYCHGSRHGSAQDVHRVVMPTAAECGACHPAQLREWRGGKHSRAWIATGSAAAFRHASAPERAGRLACLDCHRVGVAPADVPALREGGASVGLLACTACHEGHAFSRLAARQPETCARCHASTHPQWGAWATSPHGTGRLVHGGKVNPDAVATPTCQVCHFPHGRHAQRTPWGTMGLPLVAPGDAGWTEDREVLLRALGVLGPGGADGERGAPFRDARIGPLDHVEHLLVRKALVDICLTCHEVRFVRETLTRREAALRECDRIAADAIRAVVPLHVTGALDGEFPDLVRARASGMLLERRLAEMIFDHRARFVAALFHGSPTADGWLAALRRDREDVQRLAMEVLVLPAQARRGPPAKRR